jgi:predicted transcriptional regulator
MRLGELEKLVLNYFWEVKMADAKQVYAYFKRQRGGSLNTIQSTLDRLYRKGLLKRHKAGHAFLYQAAKPRALFIEELIKDVTQDFIEGDENNLLAAFASMSKELDEKQFEKLEQMIKAYRQANEEHSS